MQIKGITKKYGNFTALDAIDIDNIHGVHGLLGENGAGKTTLLRIIATVSGDYSGCISHENLNWTDIAQVRKRIGYLPQKFGVYNQLTVREALTHIAILKGISGNIEAEVDNVIGFVNLEEKANVKVKALSGGMVRRLGIAQAILGNPDILIVDEPTAGLDPEERMRFRRMLRSLGSDRIVLFSTHIVDDVEAVCDEVTILHKGRVIMRGTCIEIAKAAVNKVWNVVLESDNSIQLPVDAVITQDKLREGKRYVRLLYDSTPCEGATMAEPTTEEGYLYLIHK